MTEKTIMMTDKEVLEYYSKHINTKFEWYEKNGKLFTGIEEEGRKLFFELAGSDFFFYYRPTVEEHIKNKPVREILKNIIENG